MVVAVAGIILRRRCSRLSVVPATAADAAAVAATVAHRIVAADVRRGTVAAAAAVYKRNDT